MLTMAELAALSLDEIRNRYQAGLMGYALAMAVLERRGLTGSESDLWLVCGEMPRRVCVNTLRANAGNRKARRANESAQRAADQAVAGYLNLTK